MVSINRNKCLVCGGCIDLCPKTAIVMVNDTVIVDPGKCGACKICVKVCPIGAPFVA